MNTDLRRRIDRLERELKKEQQSAEAQAHPVVHPAPASRSERCENCRFWYRQYVALDKTDRLAQCLRYPPAVVGIGAMMNEFPLVSLDEEYEASRFPVTAQDDWCGEWQPATPRQPAA